MKYSSLASITGRVLSVILIGGALASCSHHPVVPEAKNVKVSREDAASDCQELGRVQGSVSSARGTIEQAIEDMKLDAARKGANYVRMEAAGAMGTSASGTAFRCPL